MQVERRTNLERSRETTEALLLAARDLFVERGFAGTSTPAIVERAQVTRGALYHHFPDKKAIFRAVLEREAAAVKHAILERESLAGQSGALDLLQTGAEAYLDAMDVPGRTRLLLIEGPSVLGKDVLADIETEHAAGSLHEGVAALFKEAGLPEDPLYLQASVDLLSAAFDRTALALVAGKPSAPYRRAIRTLLGSFARSE